MHPELFGDSALALYDVCSSSTIMIGGMPGKHHGRGVPTSLLKALKDKGVSDLTLVGELGDAVVLDMITGGCVSKLVCPPLDEGSWTKVEASGIDVEPVPAGVLAERIRSAGAGIGSFLVATRGDGPVGTVEEYHELDGRKYLLHAPLKADLALLRAHRADTLGNLVYQGEARNWNPTMATAANIVVVEVDEIVDAGNIDPEVVITPGIFVDRIVCNQLPAS